MTEHEKKQFDEVEKKIRIAFYSFANGCPDVNESIRLIDEAEDSFMKLKKMLGYYRDIETINKKEILH